jgi:hypothetical protein
MADHADKSQPWIPLAGGASDGWSKDGEATATCYCGAVQLAFVSTFNRSECIIMLMRSCF